MQFKGSIPCAPAQLTPAGRAKVAAAQARAPIALPASNNNRSASTAGADADAEGASSACTLAQHRRLLQQRFNEAEQELEEREAFVSSMQQMPVGQQLRPDAMAAMRAEAASKVQEMRQLHEQIRRLDVQLQLQRQQEEGTDEEDCGH